MSANTVVVRQHISSVKKDVVSISIGTHIFICMLIIFVVISLSQALLLENMLSETRSLSGEVHGLRLEHDKLIKNLFP